LAKRVYWRIPFIIIVVVAIGLAYPYNPLTRVNEPHYIWKDDPLLTYHAEEVRARFDFEPSGIDLYFETLETSDFMGVLSTDISNTRNSSFKVLLLWSPGKHQKQEAWPQRFPNGSLNWVDRNRYVLFKPFNEGMGHFTGDLIRKGEYPWDRYSIVLVFGLNGTVSLKQFSSSVNMPTSLKGEWAVSQRFKQISLDEIKDQLSTLGFDPEHDYDFLDIDECPDFYQLTIDFSRQWPAIFRGFLAFWAPAIFLFGLLYLAIERRKQLKISYALELFIGIGLATLPFIFGARQILPPRLTLIEIIFYFNVLISIGLAAWVIANKLE